MAENRIGDFIQTYTGTYFYPLDPREEEIHIEDIAQALSNQCRFSGHLRCFYGVGQHSLMVASILPREKQLWGLLHDASEAYLVDLPRPIKYYSVIGEEYQKAERRLMEVIAGRFALPGEFWEDPQVKEADNMMLQAEARDLFQECPKWVGKYGKVWDGRILPNHPAFVVKEFLSKYKEYSS